MNKIGDNKLNKLAKSYFEGNLSFDEENELFDILNKNDETRSYFNELEKEWTYSHTPSEEAENAWNHLLSELKSSAPKQTSTHIIPLHRRLVAAAAIALVLISSVATYVFINQYSKTENYYTCVAPMGGKAEVILPDGSHVWLNAGSNLRYSTLFNSDNRRVEINGEGYFEIAKHNGAKFTVSTKGYDVVIHGTKFNVSAYPEDSSITTTLLEGSVEVNREKESIFMSPGETITLDKQSGKLTKTKSVGKACAWVSNSAEYDNISLGELTKILSRRFDLDITIKSTTLEDERFAISLHNGEDFNAIVRGLKDVVPIRVVQCGQDVYIYDK